MGRLNRFDDCEASNERIGASVVCTVHIFGKWHSWRRKVSIDMKSDPYEIITRLRW